jgi:hypothetical protein
VDNSHSQLIKDQYESSAAGDSVKLFQAVLQIAEETGLETALAILEECVLEKRLAWFERVGQHFPRTDNPLMDGYRLFYETYLKVCVPADGEIVETTGAQVVTRWWNRCPTLEACRELGLDTRLVCRAVYHRPVDALLKRIDPRLSFERDYTHIRPYASYCEERIVLVEETQPD